MVVEEGGGSFNDISFFGKFVFEIVLSVFK